MSYNVFILASRTVAEQLNENLPDGLKVAFQDAKGDEFFAYEDTDMSNIPSTKYQLGTVSQSVVDGSGIVSKDRKMFPRPW